MPGQEYLSPFRWRSFARFQITELVHKKDVCRSLLTHSVKSNLDFNWLKVFRVPLAPTLRTSGTRLRSVQAIRFYWAPSKQGDPIKSCVVKMANAQFYYGFEYLGVQEKLVQTPLTDRWVAQFFSFVPTEIIIAEWPNLAAI